MTKRKQEGPCTRTLKHKPYGTTGTNPYCTSHDQHCPYSISKKSERQKAKRQIKKDLKD